MELSFILAFLLLCIGIYGICVSKNIIKSIMLYNIIQSSVIIIFLNFGSVEGLGIPIISDLADKTRNMVDPLPQALMITAIVIGAAITALGLMLSIKIFHYYGTLNWKELIEREG